MTTEARKRANKKWNSENMATVACTMRKEKAQEMRRYAENNGLTLANFARLAMQYCKNNNINLQQEPEEGNSEK